MADVNTLITALLPDLHTDSIANLVWWTKPELIQWADEACKRAARSFALFIAIDNDQTAVDGTVGLFPVPRMLAVLHVSVGNRSLRASSTTELRAMDPQFMTTAGFPQERWYADRNATGAVGIQPIANASSVGLTIRALFTQYPAELDTAELNTTIPGPLVFGDYIQTAIRAEANSKESDAAMPEVAKHDREMLALYESLFSYYWGDNQ